MGIFLEGRSYDTKLTLKVFHQTLDKLSCSITHKDVLLMYTKILGSKKAVYSHSGRILCKQCVKVRSQLIFHSLRRKVRIYKITEIHKLGIAPVSAVSTLKKLYTLIFIGNKHGFCNVQILNVINLVPELTAEPLSLDLGIVEHGDDSENLLVIFVLTKSTLIGLKERNIMCF